MAGQYRIDEVGMTYTVLIVDGKLTVRWPRQSDLVLEAVGGDRFVSGPWTVTFTRTAVGAVDGLTLTARRLRRLRAERLTTVEVPAVAATRTGADHAR